MTRWDYDAHLADSVKEVGAWLDDDNDKPIPFGGIAMMHDWVKEQLA